MNFILRNYLYWLPVLFFILLFLSIRHYFNVIDELADYERKYVKLEEELAELEEELANTLKACKTNEQILIKTCKEELDKSIELKEVQTETIKEYVIVRKGDVSENQINPDVIDIIINGMHESYRKASSN